MPQDYGFGQGLEESPLSRRARARLRVKLKVAYKLIKSGDKLFRFESVPQEFDDTSSTRDISASGISFFCDRLIPVGSVVELRVELSAGEKPVQCLARVERTEELMRDRIYIIGLYYLDLSRENRLRIDDFVSSKGEASDGKSDQ